MAEWVSHNALAGRNLSAWSLRPHDSTAAVETIGGWLAAVLAARMARQVCDTLEPHGMDDAEVGFTHAIGWEAAGPFVESVTAVAEVTFRWALASRGLVGVPLIAGAIAQAEPASEVSHTATPEPHLERDCRVATLVRSRTIGIAIVGVRGYLRPALARNVRGVARCRLEWGVAVKVC